MYKLYYEVNAMEEEYSYEYAMGMEKKKGVGYWIGKAIKLCGLLLIVFVYGFFLVRLFISGDPAAVKGFVWNNVSYDAYTQAPADFKVMHQEVKSIFTEDGTFRVTEVKYVPEIGQLQTTVRYNNSTLKAVKEHYKLPDIPVGEAFIYILKDANGNEYRDYSFKGMTKNVYNYRQLIFDGIDLQNAGTLTLDIYYIDEVNFTYSPYATILIYDEDAYSEEFDLADSLPAAVTDGFSQRPAYLTKGE